jgi:L-iditol 2-dehydrogenase
VSNEIKEKTNMRVAVYHNNHDVRLEERPIPKISHDELLVKVIASGICGSDVMEWYRIKKAPLILGHEITGEIVETGKGVKKYKKGDRVFVSHHVPCEACRYCKRGHESVCDTLRKTNFDPGGFAEYIRVPAINLKNGVYVLPKEISFEEGVFIEPLGCVVRGQRFVHLQKGDSVLVLGSGMTGILHIALAKARGAGRIIATDINDYRLKSAKQFGANIMIHSNDLTPDKLKELNDGRLADVVIVCTGNETAICQSMRCVERGGSILFFAPPMPGVEIPMPLGELWKDEITMMTSYAASPRDIKETIELIKTKIVYVRDMVTHRLPLAETGRGFQLVASAQNSVKVIIEPQR